MISSRRSIAAKFNLEKNKILTYEDFTWVRLYRFFPGDENKLIGKKIKYNIAQVKFLKREVFNFTCEIQKFSIYKIQTRRKKYEWHLWRANYWFSRWLN